LSDIDQLDALYKKLDDERKDAENIKGSYYTQAKDKLKAILNGEDIATLKKQAKSTPGTEDDKLVDRLEAIETGITDNKSESKLTAVKRDAIAEKLTGLQKIDRDYSSKEYDSSRSYFERGFDIDSLLKLYLVGKLTHTDMWSKIDNEQKFTPKPTYHSSSDYSSPSHHSTSSYSGGFSSSSHSSGGSFGGGSHHTGGGF
jgi:hypothetical protein